MEADSVRLTTIPDVKDLTHLPVGPFTRIHPTELIDEILSWTLGMFIAKIKVKRKVRKAGRFGCPAIRSENVRNNLKLQRVMAREKV